MLRFLTAGESHGPGLTCIVEGLPSGIELNAEGLGRQLARRRLGYGRGNRMKIEKDVIEILGGVRFGKTLGSPVSVLIRNTEAARWADEMSVEPGTTDRPLTAPRPGHADLVGMQKYETKDARDILERASARETAARTVAGYTARAWLEAIGLSMGSHVVAVGEVAVPDGTLPGPDEFQAVDESPVRCADAETAEAMIAEIDAARADRDTLGGVVEVVVHGLPVGLGSHVHWDRRMDGRLAAALMSIQAIKGVEVGDGFTTASRRGSAAHDEMAYEGREIVRATNRAGGTEGGMTTGEPLRVRAAMKPISTLMKPLETVDVATGEAASAFRERSDTCAVPAAGIVAEQMVAIVLADAVLEMFGGDSIDQVISRVAAHAERIRTF